LCLAIHVHKCTYCVQQQDTLQGIASELGTDWLQVLCVCERGSERERESERASGYMFVSVCERVCV